MSHALDGSGGRAEQPQAASTLPAPTYCAHCGQPIAPALRDSTWAKMRLGYRDDQGAAFWKFVHANGVPIIRTGPKTVRFDESTVNAWLATKAKGRA